MGSYFVIITCRNSEQIIEKSIHAIQNQTLKPEYIIVIDDGSTDKTREKLLNIQANTNNTSFFVISHKDLGYDVTRVVKNWNEAISFSYNNNLKPTDYHMISTDDTLYPPDYAQKIISFMDNNPKISCVSGEYTKVSGALPHGAGRIVRNSFFKNTIWNGYYPEQMGYESAILYESNRIGYDYTILPSIRFEHIRPLGKEHKFKAFGASMKTLGYHPLYVFARFLKNVVTGTETGRMGAFFMLFFYLSFRPAKTGFNSLYDYQLRDYIKNLQKEKLKKLIRLNIF